MLKRVYHHRSVGLLLGVFFLLPLFIGWTGNLRAQSGSYLEYHDLFKTLDNGYQLRSDAFEASVYRYMSGLGGQEPQAERSVHTIPVVIHVMHLPQDAAPDDATSNLTDATIRQAIEYLNQAFRNTGAYAGGPQHTNAGIDAADVEIDFCIAQIDPNGNPTNGINRVATAYSNLNRDDNCPGGGGPQDVCMKYLSQWDSHKYLNIWIVNEICTSAGVGCEVNAYSLMPGAHGTLLDGIVIEAGVMGASAGATTELIHEVGHYLGLFNTYYQPSIAPDGCTNTNCLAFGDGICDTPPDSDRGPVDCQAGETVNSCGSDADDTSANNPFDSDVQDMYENFMDDGGPYCRNTFTPMQKVRMRFALTTERQSLLSNVACSNAFENVGFAAWIRPPVITCDTLIRPQIKIFNNGDLPVTSIEFWQRVDAFPVQSWAWVGNLPAGDTIVMDLPAKFLASGKHTWTVRITGINDQGPDDNSADNTASLSFLSLRAASPISEFPFCEDVENGLQSFEQVNWDGKVGFDYFPYDKCLPTLGKAVMRYNSNGVWENGAGMGADPNGTVDALYSAPIDLSGFNQATFTFSTAYKEGLPEHGLSLSVWVLAGCETLPIKIYEQSSAELESSQSATNPTLFRWVPEGCQDWKQHVVSLQKYAGQEIRVMVQIELESEFSQNFYIDNFCFDASDICALPLAIPAKTGAFQADTACLAPDGWTHFWKYAGSSPVTTQDLLIFSVYGIDSSDLQLAPSQVRMYVAPSYGKGGYDMSDAPYVQNQDGWFVAGRYWSLNPEQDASTPMKVRIYFNETDLEDLRSRVGLLPVGLPPLTVFRIGVDPDPTTGHEGTTKDKWGEFAISTLGAAGETSWTATDMGGYRAAEFSLSDWDGIGFGLSGEGQGMGPTYPPKISIFDARQSLGNVAISWEISREFLSTTYQVWRKGDKEASFELIGTVPSLGNSWGTQTYSYLDPSPLEGTTAYYVTLSHQTPLVAYSDTVSITFDLAGLVVAYPNPTAGLLHFTVDSELSEPVHAAIYNAGWQLIKEKTWRNSPAEQEPFDLGSLPPGVYFYVVRFMRNGELMDVRGKILRIPEG
ncbi:MAG: zinc-dependent metalloprotease [Bacteroidia bacterium]|nr:zinc-dependent metalloprotease [Bacteroidia bacterium]